MIRRRGTPYEIGDMACRCDISLGLQFGDKSAIPQVLDKLDRSVYPLHLRFSDGDLISVPAPAPLHRLPNQIRDLHRASQWLNAHHPLDYAERLACLGHNDSKIVLNVTHSYADGTYFKHLLDHLFEAAPINLPSLPPILENRLPAQFAAAADVALPWTYDPCLTRFDTHHGTLDSPSKFIKYETLRFSGDELLCYNRQTRKFENTTDYMWLSQLLATAVHSGKLPAVAGVSTCVDTRSLMTAPLPDGYTLLKCFSQVTASTPLSGGLTLREVACRMRADMARRRAALEDIARIKYGSAVPAGRPLKGLVMEISNMGAMAVRWPLIDAWAGLNMHADLSGDGTSIMSFSVATERRDDFVMRFRYSDARLGDDEALAIARSLRHVVTRVPLDATVQAAFDELRTLQRQR
jgi:hypothetical protein